MSVITNDRTPGGYWHDTERQIAISTHRDKQAARQTNAAFLLINATPFGSLPDQRKASA